MRIKLSPTTLAAVIAATVLVVACDRGPDPNERITDGLKDAKIDDVNVDYDRDAKVVHLKGAVGSAAEKSEAESIAERVVGTSGSIANELTIKGVNDRTADDMDRAIHQELDAKVNNDMVLDKRDINFDVNNAVVTIKGFVRTEAERRQVSELARSTANVKDIVNSLEIDSQLAPDKVKGTSGANTPQMRRDDDNREHTAGR